MLADTLPRCGVYLHLNLCKSDSNPRHLNPSSSRNSGQQRRGKSSGRLKVAIGLCIHGANRYCPLSQQGVALLGRTVNTAVSARTGA